MKNKILSMFLSLVMLLISIPGYSFAEENGKVIFITMNRTNLEDMMSLESLKKESDKRGQIALMNIRGDGGTDDGRSYATIGAGTRASVSSVSNINFEELDKENESLYQSLTNQVPKGVNDMTVNKSINNNDEKGSYGAVLGSLGQTLSENNLKVAVLGNSDIVKDDDTTKIRNIGLVAMDNFGRVDEGNIENINKVDYTMPYGISTDYDVLLSDTKKFYERDDAIFVDLGDTYRLDEYKSYLNSQSYENMKKGIYSKIDKYLEAVFNMVNENDTVYVVSPFVKDQDYKDRNRLAPVIKFDNQPSGMLSSATTRRDGVIANLDLGVDILNEFGLKNDMMIGKPLSRVESEDTIQTLSYELEKMASISLIRADIVNTFVGIVSASWIIGLIALLFKNRIPNNKRIFTVIKEFIKLGIIMPLALLISPIFNFNTQFMIALGVIITTIVLYIIGRLLFKDDIKQMGLFALLTILLIVIDCILGTNLMENNVMSYDAIIGARYYGVGNEYEGVTIASAIFAMAVLLNYNKMPKWGVIIFSVVILITSAYPGMGANVGGAISESVAYLLFILLIFNIKLDFKRIILLGLSAVVVVAVFAAIDIISGSESHLSLFINQILVEGPSAIIETFTRKIQMNLKLAKTSVWVNILLVGIFIISTLIFKPSKQVLKVSKTYPMLFKGFIASMVGCIVTLLVNDSGIVAASTASIYIFIPLLIVSINMAIFEERE